MKRQNSITRTTRLLACGATFAMTIFAAQTAAGETTECPVGEGAPSICGVVYDDANSDGAQGTGESNIGGPDILVLAVGTTPGTPTTTVTETSCDAAIPDSCGLYSFVNLPGGTYDVCVIRPTDTQTCADHSEMETVVVPEGTGTTDGPAGVPQDLGRPGAPIVSSGPGTGTPGYWKNHPEAWPVTSIQIGTETYTRDQAIALMGKVGGDKSITIFSSLLSAKLNVAALNPDSCVNAAITAGDTWFTTYEPNGMPGTKISGSSVAWVGVGGGDATHQILDNYNNGLLPCAHHRD